MSKKTLTILDVGRDPKGSARKASEIARQQARFHVIQAKRSLGGKPIAYAEGKLVDAGVDGRSNLKVKA
jgi:hypothetical protein